MRDDLDDQPIYYGFGSMHEMNDRDDWPRHRCLGFRSVSDALLRATQPQPPKVRAKKIGFRTR